MTENKVGIWKVWTKTESTQIYEEPSIYNFQSTTNDSLVASNLFKKAHNQIALLLQAIPELNEYDILAAEYCIVVKKDLMLKCTPIFPPQFIMWELERTSFYVGVWGNKADYDAALDILEMELWDLKGLVVGCNVPTT